MVNKINQSNTAVFSSIGKSLKLNNTQTSLGYSLMYGIGKIYPFKKLIFRFGIEMSGRYFTPWVIETTIEYFDTNNTKYQTLKFNDTYAGNYIFGTTLLSGIHYNFYKSWSVGIEMGNSLYYGIQKGKEVNTVEDYGSNGNLSSTNTTSVKINSYHWYVSYFRSSISIFYTF